MPESGGSSGVGVRADGFDFRDVLYSPHLGRVPLALSPERPEFVAAAIPVLTQPEDGPCTGYALATLANALLRFRAVGAGRDPAEEPPVSPDMIYDLARRYDDHVGQDANSTVRGAMKAWHKHGVCSEAAWAENEREQEEAAAAEAARQKSWQAFQAARHAADDLVADPKADDAAVTAARDAARAARRAHEEAQALARDAKRHRVFDRNRARDAAQRPLGAYARVPHTDLSALHAALAETGALIASLELHDGWVALCRPPDEAPNGPVLAQMASNMAEQKEMESPFSASAAETGRIPYPSGRSLLAGGHAVVVVGYDGDGLWIQNSWGPDWGKGGLAHIRYADWLENARDVWAARLGVPVAFDERERALTALSRTRRTTFSYSFADLVGHFVNVDQDGGFRAHATFASTARGVRQIFDDEVRSGLEPWRASLSAGSAKGQKGGSGGGSGDARVTRVLFVASSGVGGTAGESRWLARRRAGLLAHGVYPIQILWVPGFLQRMDDVLRRAHADSTDARGADLRAGQLDDRLEHVARTRGGFIEWLHVQDQAVWAAMESPPFADGVGALHQVAVEVARLAARELALDRRLEVHLLGHSVGALILEALLGALNARGVTVAGATLWAPAVSMSGYEARWAPALTSARAGGVGLGRLHVAALSPALEDTDEVAGLYRRSFLHLLSRGCEPRPRGARADAVPFLGLAASLSEHPTLADEPSFSWQESPGDGAFGPVRARRHVDFLDDDAAFRAAVAQILGAEPGEGLVAPDGR